MNARSFLLFISLIASSAVAQVRLPGAFVDETIAGGLDQPTSFAFLPDGRALVTEQRTGRIRMIVNGALAVTDPVGTVGGLATVGPQGLLGIAVDPAWPARPFVYVHFDHAGTSTIFVSRLTASGDLSDGSSGNLSLDGATPFDLLTDLPDQQPVHNGGTLRFGPDGMLYASLGDDQDPCAAQDPSSLLGKILRLRVSDLPASGSSPPPKSALVAPGNPFAGPDDAARLVWALGLRNPFRFHVDPRTGDLFVADVGANDFEEIDRVDAAGMNLGWPFREGTETQAPSGCVETAGAPLVTPILAWDRRGLAAASVISAGIYRPADYPFDGSFPSEYDGDVFYSDYFAGFLRRLHFDGGSWSIAQPVAGQPNATHWATGLAAPVDFGIGPDGALWWLSQSAAGAASSGSLHRIRYDVAIAVPALRGTVNAGAGTIVDVLRVNGSAGGANRTETVRITEGITVSLDPPPSRVRARFALFAWRGRPTPASMRALPQGVGSLAFGICLHGETPLRVANNLANATELCAPTLPSSPAPWTATFPPGHVRARGAFTLQAIIQDGASAAAVPFSVTNGILVRIR
ncbi:MAG: PQQ-dependent sugar dehydrogenase [Planctomycetes bacterium]|nr:PQQ-dependent sugar dehydrogenase [Planctomycetota bacterium]MBI3843811.1 PQQ-dependent sugar dehydrogenase [Planctomycetota bacterium]